MTASDPNRPVAHAAQKGPSMTKYPLFFCIFFVAGCVKPQDRNLFIVPEDYRGPLLVVLVEGIEQAYRRQDLQNVYTFPDSGVLCVASFENFTKGFRGNHARYASGIPIPTGDGADYQDDRFEMRMQKWSVTTSTEDGVETKVSDPEILFAIGSSDDIQDIEQSWLAEEPRFRRDLCVEDNL